MTLHAISLVAVVQSSYFFFLEALHVSLSCNLIIYVVCIYSKRYELPSSVTHQLERLGNVVSSTVMVVKLGKH